MEQGSASVKSSIAQPVERIATPGRRRSVLRRVVQLVLVLGPVAATLYWLRFAPIAVTAFTAGPGSVSVEVMGTGTLEARVSATLSPKISGRIVELLVDQGDRVTAGQVVFRLDDAELRKQVEMAEDVLAAARIAVERQTAEIQRAGAVLELAHIEQRRVRDLLENDNAAAIEVDRTFQALRIAEAEGRRADAALAEAKAQVLVAEKALAFQRARLADTVVTAPFAGLIARRDRDPGDIVVPGASVLLLLNTDEIWVSAWVDETEMARVEPDQAVRIVFRSEPEQGYAGSVVRLGREADRETREFLVDVRADRLPQNWAVGQRAEVYIETARAVDVLSIPARAVVWRGKVPGAFVEEGGRAVWRALELGLRGAERVEVRSGTRAGARLVIPEEAASAALRDGQRVSVQ